MQSLIGLAPFGSQATYSGPELRFCGPIQHIHFRARAGCGGHVERARRIYSLDSD